MTKYKCKKCDRVFSSEFSINYHLSEEYNITNEQKRKEYFMEIEK